MAQNYNVQNDVRRSKRLVLQLEMKALEREMIRMKNELAEVGDDDLCASDSEPDDDFKGFDSMSINAHKSAYESKGNTESNSSSLSELHQEDLIQFNPKNSDREKTGKINKILESSFENSRVDIMFDSLEIDKTLDNSRIEKVRDNSRIEKTLENLRIDKNKHLTIDMDKNKFINFEKKLMHINKKMNDNYANKKLNDHYIRQLNEKYKLEYSAGQNNPGDLNKNSNSNKRTNNDNNAKQLQDQIDYLTEQLNSTKVNKEMGNNVNLSQNNKSDTNDEILKTMTKFMARQTLAKDLPIFSGKPEEWPLFYNQYCNTTTQCEFSDRDNLSRLQKCLKGEALDSVRALLISPLNVSAVIDTLKRRFGRDDFIIKSMINKVKSIPTLKDNSHLGIINFATSVQNLTVTIETLVKPGHLYNPQLLEDLENKLPPILSAMWNDFIGKKDSDYSLREFADWIIEKANAVSRRCTFENSNVNNEAKKETKRTKANIYSTTEKIENPCKVCKQQCKSAEACEKFKMLHIDDRWKVVTDNTLCFSCLKANHSSRFCRKKNKCDINGCKKNHHKLLHKDHATNEIVQENDQELCALSLSNEVSTKLRILPVYLKGKSFEIKTYALLDPGSTVTLIASDIAEKLNLEGNKVPLCLQWANGDEMVENDSVIINPEISGVFPNAKYYTLNSARTVKYLPLAKQSIDKGKLVKLHPFLKNVDFESYSEVRPTVLIGENNGLIMATRQLVHTNSNSPIASKTRLGWTISGNSGSSGTPNFISHVYNMVKTDDEDLHALVKESFKIDDMLTKNDKLKSRDDDLGLEIMKSTTIKVEQNRWETGLLWKCNEIDLPDSKKLALKRLELLEKKLDKDDDLKIKYESIINDYMKKDYLIEVDKNYLIHKRIWYLPHFPVVNPLKPGKVRIVFDAAAKTKNVCLNDFLIQGPDLLKSLPGVLFRFREGAIGFIGDIKEMFHRIKIREQDSTAQLILWRGNERNKDPKILKMSVMMFGATCSPSSAIYVKDRNASEFEYDYPEAVNEIKNNHYMGDYLGSADNEETAVKFITEVTKVHAAGGFQICNWVCSSQNVLLTIPAELRKYDQTQFNLEKNTNTGRVLGIYWNSTTDCFSFSSNFVKIDPDILAGRKRPTKRQMLKLVMSIYDPLGFISNSVIGGRILLQKVWQIGLKWDEQITDELFDKWKKWLNDLQNISTVQINRSYSNYSNKNRLENSTIKILC